MLEHVTANQMRFVTPGLTADARGVALGRFCLVLLPSLDRVFGFFRGLSHQTSIDDLLSELAVEQVVTPLKSREFVVLLPVRSSNAADGVAAIAALNRGLTFTGTSKHYVQFRDTRSPLGYDVDGLQAGADGDYVLYANDFVQSYRRARSLSLEQLVLDLSLVDEPLDALLEGEEALLRVASGLWRPVMGYLHRNRRPCQVAACAATDRSRGGPDPRPLFLMRTVLEPRMERLFRRTPGVEVLRFKTERVAVQLGYRHPVELTSLSNIFNRRRLYLFCGERGCLEQVDAEGLQFVAAADLVRLGVPPRQLDPAQFEPFAPAPVAVPLRLVPSPGLRRSALAARVPMAQAGWVKKLVYLLPPQVLERTRVCLTTQDIFLLGEGGLEFFPLGELNYEAARGVMVPLGFQLVPRVHPDVLRGHMERQAVGGATGPELIFFLLPEDPVGLQLHRGAFVPLSRRVLADVPLHTPQHVALPAALPGEDGAMTLVNDPVGLFPLWGFDRGGDRPRGPVDGEGE